MVVLNVIEDSRDGTVYLRMSPQENAYVKKYNLLHIFTQIEKFGITSYFLNMFGVNLELILKLVQLIEHLLYNSNKEKLCFLICDMVAKYNVILFYLPI